MLNSMFHKSRKPEQEISEGKGILTRSIHQLGGLAFIAAAVYLIFGTLWIILSDELLGFLAHDKETILSMSMVKGLIYVAVSGSLFFVLSSYAFKRAKNTEEKLIKSYEELACAHDEIASAYGQLAASQESLQYFAYHDQLTGLYNRFALGERFGQITRERDAVCALLFIDIDNFKYINDTVGHKFGDLLIRETGQRLLHIREDGITVYRLGGDEFIVLIEDCKEAKCAGKIASMIHEELKNPLKVGDSSLFITVSIGVSRYPSDGKTIEELLKSADIAVYKAKDKGRNRTVFYETHMYEPVRERMVIEKQLRTALQNNEFELYYQPQLDISSGRVSGLEALIRWKNPSLGYVSPLKFISIAEATHLIIPIGEWVLKKACRFIKTLHRLGHHDLTVSVNISMLQLSQDNFVEVILESLKEEGLDPSLLEIEITESILMESYEAIEAKLKTLRNSGVGIALDDFGKGYSSLNYLRQLPISTLKIDKSFIDTIEPGGKDRSLTDHIVMIGRSMDLCVVAEGVETQEQMDYLIKHKCHKIQGYFFSKPLPEGEAISALSASVSKTLRQFTRQPCTFGFEPSA